MSVSTRMAARVARARCWALWGRAANAGKADDAGGGTRAYSACSGCPSGGGTGSSGADLPSRAAEILRHTQAVRFPTLDALTLRLITRDCDLYHATYRELAADTTLPWWGFLWPGGYGMAKHLVESSSDLVEGKRVLDFACGNGASSVLALAYGAESVVANDICPVACASARLNVQINAEAAASGSGRLKLPTDWMRRLELAPRNMIGENLHADGVDVVIAGDVLYDDELAREVFPWLRRQAARGVEVLIGDPGRWVLAEMAERGERDAVLERVTEYELDEITKAEHHGLHTGAVWRVLPPEPQRRAQGC